MLLIHFGFKDNLVQLNIVFYAFPLLILIGIGVSFFFRRKQNHTTLLILLVGLSVYWIQDYYFSTESDRSEKISKILFWNVAKKDSLPIDNISKQVITHEPKILALAEVTRKTLSDFDSLKIKLLN